jgi:WD40 repeat protein
MPKPVPGEDFTKPRQYRGPSAALQSVAISSDSKIVLSVGDDKGLVSWAIDGEQANRHHEFMSPGVAAAFIPGRKEAVACDGGMIVVVDLTQNTVRARMTNPRGGIVCLAVEPDGSRVLTGCSDGNLRRWNIASQSVEKEFDVGKGQVISVAVSRDGSLAAAGDSDGSISVWNLGAGRLVRKWKAHTGYVTALAFDPDGKRLFSTGGGDKTGAVYTADGSKLLAKTGVHEGVPVSAAWTADGKRVLSGAADRMIRLWDAANPKAPVWSVIAEGKVFSLAVDSQDRFVLAATSQNTVDRFPLPGATTPKE